jgi:hypothetical protein
MARIVRTERYKRGLFGWFFKLVFLAFNVFMAIVFGLTIWSMNQYAPPDTLTKPGAGAGMTIGFGVILFIWALGAFILGMLTHFTRGKKIIIEETHE